MIQSTTFELIIIVLASIVSFLCFITFSKEKQRIEEKIVNDLEKVKVKSRLKDLENEVERLSTKNKYKVILKNGTVTELNDVWEVSERDSYFDGFVHVHTVNSEDIKFYNKYNEVIAKFKIDEIEHYYEVKG